MGMFGWSYPPGAANDPNAPYNQQEGPCEVCGKGCDDCICPECDLCGSQGDPDCYDPYQFRPGFHGLFRTQAQIDSLADAEVMWAADCEAEAKYWEEQRKEGISMFGKSDAGDIFEGTEYE